MIKEICDYEQCTGCMACLNVCSKQAIHLTIDKEGFERPEIDGDLCVDCGLCQKTCPMNYHPMVHEAQQVFSGWSKDENIRVSSSSGGAFTEIAKIVLSRGGVVFGCALNKELKAEHIYVETLEDLSERLTGSKYVQSHIGDSYKQVKSFLKQGRKVLFSGTPCQIAGLKNYLRKDYDNLLTIDLICHGVPSPMLFEEYKKYIQEHENMKLTNVSFRCKKSSWIFFNMTLSGHVEKSSALKTYIGNYYEDPYLRGFIRDYFLRPSCHQCHFTSTKRCADFTIADWWGYHKTAPEDKDYACKGVSLLMANTSKAVGLLPLLNMTLRKRTIDEAKKTNQSLSHPFPMRDTRMGFWKDYRLLSFDEMVKKYMMPEKVSWSVNMRQHCRNTDSMLSLINLLMLPQRAIAKMRRILNN